MTVFKDLSFGSILSTCYGRAQMGGRLGQSAEGRVETAAYGQFQDLCEFVEMAVFEDATYL